MEIEIRTVHISKKSWCHDLAMDYVKKISPFEKIDLKILKDEKRLLDKVKENDRVFACDERGVSLTSRELSKKFSQLRDGGIQKLFIFIGGPFGLPPEVIKRADLNLQLSKLVMNQEVALTVLMEQVFRSYTIINKHPYHND